MDVDENENENEEERVEPEVDAALVAEIEAMGFTRNKAVRAIHTTGTTSVEQAVNWIVEHAEDVELIEDRPLVVAKSESQAQAEALQGGSESEGGGAPEDDGGEEGEGGEGAREAARAGAHPKRQRAPRREEERGGVTDEAQPRGASHRKTAKSREPRQRFWKSSRRTRRERRRKLGLPEELTEEEKARERQRAEEKAAAAKEEQRKKAEAGLVVKPVTAVDDLRKILVEIKKTHKDTNDEGVATCFKTLLLYLGNVMKDPEDAKFRTIKLANGAFQKRVQSVGGDAFLRRVGFEDDGETLAMPREKVDRVLINLAGAEINSALSNPFFGVL